MNRKNGKNSEAVGEGEASQLLPFFLFITAETTAAWVAVGEREERDA